MPLDLIETADMNDAALKETLTRCQALGFDTVLLARDYPSPKEARAAAQQATETVNGVLFSPADALAEANAFSAAGDKAGNGGASDASAQTSVAAPAPVPASALTVKPCQLFEKADAARVKKFANNVVVAVRGGTAKANNFAVNTHGIDFLYEPVHEGKPEFDTAIARLAADNNVPVALPYAPVARASGKQAALLLKNYLLVVQLLNKFRANALFVSGARNPDEGVKPAALQSFAVDLGFTPLQAERFLNRFPAAWLEAKP